MGNQLKTILLLALALSIAVACAFLADPVMYRRSGHNEFEGTAIFTDGHEASGIHGCEIVDGMVVVTGGDPQFVVRAGGNEISAVRIRFVEPVSRNIDLQLFYSYSGEGFSAENSVFRTIRSGSSEGIINIPKASYALYRFDIEQSVWLDSILEGNEAWVTYPYVPSAIRLILLALAVFAPLCALVVSLTGRKGKAVSERQGAIALGKARRPIWTIVLCNLFLSLTVVFFQPLEHMLVHLGDFAILFENVWWIQLLVSVGITLVLSLAMAVLPPVAGRIAASASLGIGTAFLAQSLLLNDGRPLALNESWPMEVLDTFVWLGIIAMVVATAAYYAKTQGKRTELGLRTLAWILLAAQLFNFMILTSLNDMPSAEKNMNREAGYTEYLEGSRIDLPGLEKNLLNISMFRGLPFSMKKAFEFDMEAVNAETYRLSASSSKALNPGDLVEK